MQNTPPPSGPTIEPGRARPQNPKSSGPIVGPQRARHAPPEHPLTPRTPDQIEEFARLWRDLEKTVPEIAAYYQAAEATIDKWRIRLGLPVRSRLRALQSAAESRAGSTQALLGEAKKTIELQREMVRAAEAEATAALRSGELVLPRPTWCPREDREVAALMAEVQARASEITDETDLSHIQRLLTKVCILSISRLSMESGAGFAMMVESLSRTLMGLRKAEVSIPRAPTSEQALRRQAAQQMMREVREVLPPEDQAILAQVMKKAADLIMARRLTGEQARDAAASAAEAARAREAQGNEEPRDMSHNGKAKVNSRVDEVRA